MAQKKTPAEIEALLKAAENNDLQAQLELGFCYDYAFGVPQDFEKSIYWFKQAASGGEANALIRLGCKYDDGEGVEKDEVRAEHWFRQGADQGDPICMANLGEYYENGKGGLPKDLKQALFWYVTAKEKGFGAVEPAIQRVKERHK